MNYLGQPITAQTMPQLANGMDLSTLSAYASLQGLGYPMSTAMTMANQPTMIMAENNNMMPLQSELLNFSCSRSLSLSLTVLPFFIRGQSFRQPFG